MNEECYKHNFTPRKFNDKQTLLSANLTFLFYTLFTVASAIAYLIIQKRRLTTKVNYEKNTIKKSIKNKIFLFEATLATKFNAGGSMSVSLLASTIVSQWTWAASLLQSTTVGTQVLSYLSIFLETFRL